MLKCSAPPHQFECYKIHVLLQMAVAISTVVPTKHSQSQCAIYLLLHTSYNGHFACSMGPLQAWG